MTETEPESTEQIQLDDYPDQSYLRQCMTDIEVDEAHGDTVYSRMRWMKKILSRTGSKALSTERLDRILDVVRDIIVNCMEEKEDYETSHIVRHYSDISILFVHARLFVVPMLVKETPSVTGISLDHLLNILSNKYELLEYFVPHRRYCTHLMESMMDLLEDLSLEYIHNGRVHSLVNGVLPFVGYCCIGDEFKFRRSVVFLESYLRGKGPTRIWSAIILCLFVNGHGSVKILREYLENSLTDESPTSEDVVAVYMTVLRVARSGGGWPTLTEVDYKLLLRLRECGPIAFIIKSEIVQSFIGIFNEGHKAGILQSMAQDSALTQAQKISINCLSVFLQGLIDHHYVLMRGDIVSTMLSLLNDVRPYVTKNIAANRIAEIILYKLCGYHIYFGVAMKEEILRVCLQYLHIEDLSAEMVLSLFVVVSFVVVDNFSVPCLGEMVTQLSCVVEEIKLQEMDDRLGFSVWEIEEAVAQASRFLK